MGYPVGPLLSTLAQRILANLDLIDERAARIHGTDQVGPPYTDTQLLISLLGVLVFPHERTPRALCKLLANYDGLSRVVAIRYSAAGPGRVQLTRLDGETETVDPTSLTDLPKLLRHGIAHFNIRPIERNGSFAGIRVWSKHAGHITLVADLDFAELRPLARYILSALAEPRSDLGLDDPRDPLDILAHTGASTARISQGAPRIKDHVWERVLKSHNGDYRQAQRFVDGILQAASQEGSRGTTLTQCGRD
jgi:hypothetical protein